MELNTKVSDVKGVDEAKAELEEIVHYLRDPKLFSCLGVKLPKSVLLVGPLRLGKLCWQELYLEKLVCYFSLAVAVNLKKCLLVLEPQSTETGRFARHIVVPNPDVEGRRQILDSHMSNVLKGEDVDLMIIARRTPGFCGADLANLVNFATLGAAMDGAKVVTMADLEHDKDKTMMGMHKGTIVPRGMALGMVSQLPGKDETSISRKQILSLLDISMGEKMLKSSFFGKVKLVQVYQMISSKRPIWLEQWLQEMEEFLERAYNNAKTMLTTHCKELHALANALLEHETLMGSQIKAVLAQSCEEDIMPGKYWQTLPVEQSPIPLCMSSVITCKPFVLGEYAESVLLSMRRLCSKVREAIWVRRIYLIEADSQDNMIEMAFKLTRM
ncbi:UNVERIFIED_CONTAM: ATP-dependent zinc metalloprotease FTSH 5, mitochondrial [Sesamum calycinum]|uniref:ATP-dependent zinc metalloprotease FTSH, chloroplastic n=1 Tax=Sesamum calycinum TaxID=2727403 RepID=A0AAW2K849_9LAMI